MPNRVLRRERSGHGHATGPDLFEPLSDQLVANRRGIHLAHPGQCLTILELRQLLEQGLRIVVPRPQALGGREELHDSVAARPSGIPRVRQPGERIERGEPFARYCTTSRVAYAAVAVDVWATLRRRS